MQAVASSNLAGVDYSWTGRLTIAFHSGGVYEYFGVPHSIYAGLMRADSHGKYFHAHIRNRFRFRRIHYNKEWKRRNTQLWVPWRCGSESRGPWNPRLSAANHTDPMPKSVTLKQLAANQANAQKSTGPKTPTGRAVSKMNALKHGILSKEVLVGGLNRQESRRELLALHQRFWQELNPVGPVEEMLVDQIVTAHWRLRRALTAEAGEIALSVDVGQWKRRCNGLKHTAMHWEQESDPTLVMRDSAFGNQFMENQLRAVRASVEAVGELTEAAIAEIKFRGKPYGLTRELEELRLKCRQNPDGLSPEALRLKQRDEVLAYLTHELRRLSWGQSRCEEREREEEAARQAAAVLPSVQVLEKIQRYETKLERQMYRAMAQLERVQRMRQGETLPAPLTLEVSERT